MISYNAEGVKMPAIKRRENSAWVKAVAASYGKKVGEIAYIFVNDKKLMHFSYTRYIENKFREAFGFDGTSVKFIIRERNEEKK